MPIEINPGLRVAYQLTAALQTALSDGEGIAKCVLVNHQKFRQLKLKQEYFLSLIHI